jgi:hypothetical protein
MTRSPGFSRWDACRDRGILPGPPDPAEAGTPVPRLRCGRAQARPYPSGTDGGRAKARSYQKTTPAVGCIQCTVFLPHSIADAHQRVPTPAGRTVDALVRVPTKKPIPPGRAADVLVASRRVHSMHRFSAALNSGRAQTRPYPSGTGSGRAADAHQRVPTPAGRAATGGGRAPARPYPSGTGSGRAEARPYAKEPHMSGG